VSNLIHRLLTRKARPLGRRGGTDKTAIGMEGGREGGREGGHVPGLGALAGHKHEAVLDVLDLAGDGVLLEVQLHQAGLWEGGREEEVVNDCALVKPHYIY